MRQRRSFPAIISTRQPAEPPYGLHWSLRNLIADQQHGYKSAVSGQFPRLPRLHLTGIVDILDPCYVQQPFALFRGLTAASVHDVLASPVV